MPYRSTGLVAGRQSWLRRRYLVAVLFGCSWHLPAGTANQYRECSAPLCAIQLLSDRSKCVKADPRKMGGVLELAQCANDASLLFAFPMPGHDGWIQLDGAESLCIHAPDLVHPKLGYCAFLEDDKSGWDADELGRIFLPDHPSKCLAVPDGQAASIGVQLVLSDCNTAREKVRFMLVDLDKLGEPPATATSTSTLTTKTATTTAQAALTTTTIKATITATTATITATAATTTATTAPWLTTATSTAAVLTDAGDLDPGLKVFLQWSGAEGKCVQPWGINAGAMLQLWDCPGRNLLLSSKQDQFFKFLTPPVGDDGWIQWDYDRTLCLNAPGTDQVQLWYCATAPPDHLNWRISKDGLIHLASQPGKCLQLPRGDYRDGSKLALTECAAVEKSQVTFKLFTRSPGPASTGTEITTTSTATQTTTTRATTNTTQLAVALVHLRPRAQPDLCVNVSGDSPGALLQLLSCTGRTGSAAKSDCRFEVPAAGRSGVVRWAEKPDLYLEASPHDQVRLGYYDSSDNSNFLWHVDEDGRLRLVYNMHKCLDLGGELRPEVGGQQLRLTECAYDTDSLETKAHVAWWFSSAANSTEQRQREEQVKDDLTGCQWNEWSAWSQCDETCHRFGDRHIRRMALPGGDPCRGDATRLEPCKCQ